VGGSSSEEVLLIAAKSCGAEIAGHLWTVSSLWERGFGKTEYLRGKNGMVRLMWFQK
jgi:hypothetical protein